ncbi:hypothetical protein C8F01DRAFT_1151176 [Mycena amicta]|nr:hypothetical protein C8F01DRAFT_1151176 [Mycena amicta]
MPLFPFHTMARYRSSWPTKKPRLGSTPSSDSSPDLMTRSRVAPLPREITSRLALELYDHFFNDLNDSKTTLSTCSVVCKAWLPHCRRHLFFSVNMRPEFVNFLHDSSHAMDTIAPFIRNIHIDAWSPTYLAPLLVNGVFQKSTVLHLSSIHFPSFEILRTFACKFTGAARTSETESTAAAPPPFLSNFEKLAIHACSSNTIISWLLHAVSDDGARIVPPIHSLVLPDIVPFEVALVNDFLKAIAPSESLKHLELGFLAHNYDDAPVICAAVGDIDLSIHPRLRTLRVHQLTLYHFPSTPTPPTPSRSFPPLAWLVCLLQRISSTALSELTFSIWLGEEKQLDVIDWNALVQILDGPAFRSSLEALQFNVRGVDDDMDDEVRGWIAHRLQDWKPVNERLHVSFE